MLLNSVVSSKNSKTFSLKVSVNDWRRFLSSRFSGTENNIFRELKNVKFLLHRLQKNMAEVNFSFNDQEKIINPAAFAPEGFLFFRIRKIITNLFNLLFNLNSFNQ